MGINIKDLRKLKQIAHKEKREVTITVAVLAANLLIETVHMDGAYIDFYLDESEGTLTIEHPKPGVSIREYKLDVRDCRTYRIETSNHINERKSVRDTSKLIKQKSYYIKSTEQDSIGNPRYIIGMHIEI